MGINGRAEGAERTITNVKTIVVDVEAMATATVGRTTTTAPPIPLPAVVTTVEETEEVLTVVPSLMPRVSR